MIGVKAIFGHLRNGFFMFLLPFTIYLGDKSGSRRLDDRCVPYNMRRF